MKSRALGKELPFIQFMRDVWRVDAAAAAAVGTAVAVAAAAAADADAATAEDIVVVAAARVVTAGEDTPRQWQLEALSSACSRASRAMTVAATARKGLNRPQLDSATT